MKKIIRNPIFTFILGALIFSGATVLAYDIFANQIGYEPEWKASDGSDITNVGQAIDELYNIANENKHIEKGSVNVQFGSRDWVALDINFEKEFSSVPNVYYNYFGGSSGGTVDVINVTTRSFQLRYASFFGQTKDDIINWVALNVE